MKDLKKTLTQEQKDSVYEFVASWIKSGRKLDECMFNSMRTITDGEVQYTICMSNFDIDELFSVSVFNNKLNLRLSVYKDDVLNKSLVDYIQKYMNALLHMDSGELTNEEFNQITNLEIDLSLSRSKKVHHLMEKLK